MNGGSTSRYPCSRVCRSSMKLMSARDSRAPAPLRTANRAAEIFTARSKSMIPNAGPRSQCGCGSKSNARGSPCRRTSTLSAAVLPTGTLECGRFGSSSSAELRWYSIASTWMPSCLICCARARLASCTGVMSRPCRFARAISSPDVFCSRLRPSSSGMSRRRAASSVAMSSSALSGSRPRLRSPARTTSTWSRTKFGSIIGLPLYVTIPPWRLYARQCFPRPVSARGSCRRPKRSRKKCCRWSTSRSSNTASRKRSHPASTTSSSSPAAAKMRSRITSTSRWSSNRSSKHAANGISSPRFARSRT